MTDLPPLPFSPYLYTEWIAPEERVCNTMYTADQMREYAKKAVEAEREACAKACETLAESWERDEYYWDGAAEHCANSIRARR